jgi:hypothetical protein
LTNLFKLDYAGTVRKVLHIPTKEERAIKVIRKRTIKDMAYMLDKYRLLKEWVT